MNNDCLTGVGAAGQHAEYSGGQTGLFENAGKNYATADGGARIGLEDHRIAQRQCGSDRADGQDDRKVEGGDDADSSDGDTPRKAESGLF